MTRFIDLNCVPLRCVVLRCIALQSTEELNINALQCLQLNIKHLYGQQETVFIFLSQRGSL